METSYSSENKHSPPIHERMNNSLHFPHQSVCKVHIRISHSMILKLEQYTHKNILACRNNPLNPQEIQFLVSGFILSSTSSTDNAPAIGKRKTSFSVEIWYGYEVNLHSYLSFKNVKQGIINFWS